MVSTNNNEPDDDMMVCCASCGTAEVDKITLKKCTACKSVRYCSVECQREHRPQHKRACKKRMTELRDEILFKQPQSTHLGDCPICLLPLSTDLDKHGIQVCCSKVICLGCVYANQTREMNEGQHPTCPFCRHPTPDTQAESDILEMKRTEANDPVALREAGTGYSQNGDHEGAIKYWTKAAELGDAGAHYQLSVAYRDGRGVENDEKKELHHLTEAAISGHTDARCNLASYEGEKEDMREQRNTSSSPQILDMMLQYKD